MKITELSNRLTAVFVIAFILFFGVLTLSEYGEKDFPEISAKTILNGSFGKVLESYMTENFAFRDRWLSAKADIEADMGEKIVDGVYISDGRMLGTEGARRDISLKNAENVNKFADNYKGTVYFTAVPTSSGVYAELLPDYLLSNPEKSQIATLYDGLADGIRKIDTYNILKMMNESYIYYRTDTGLTSYGAYYVYRAVIQKLGFLPSSYSKYTISHVKSDFRGNLYKRCFYDGTKPDILDIYSYSGGAEITDCTVCTDSGVTYKKQPDNMDFSESDDIYNMYLGEGNPFVKINTSVNNQKKLLVIKDSTADCLIPFLIQHYSEIAVIYPEYSEKNMSFFVDPDNYEQILFLFGIDSMSNENLLEMINK
ncbi:MAG: hypothetical protein K2J08_08655 [Ruminococcus sp.]|nr:hypothetical protein [Ruminococcus sp.]